MNHNTPLSPRPLRHLDTTQRRVLTEAQLRDHGVTRAAAAERCRPGGPWQQLLPGVYLLHDGAPSDEERLHASLMYAGRPPAGGGSPRLIASVPQQPVDTGRDARPVTAYGEAMVTGFAALALHRFSSAPPLASLAQVDVLVPRTRRLRSQGPARILRTHTLPEPQQVLGLPVAPVARALADAVDTITDADLVRRLLTEAVRGGHTEPASIVRELTLARLLERPHVVDAVDALLAEGRAVAEDRLYTLVREHGIPAPLWNVDLRLPGGPHLGGLDAYWPDQAVAIELDTRAPRQDEDAMWSEYARKREILERLGITVLYITPKKLREAMEQQATVVRTALMASTDRDPASYVVVLPR
ncbi:hypothetical protein [Streptomyces sp. NPDC060194]|uniref:hypothetical protein n=1 Tax=Streptomyces sp. NPDC060194 TaxID=3347069 RepID=UPI00365CE4A7